MNDLKMDINQYQNMYTRIGYGDDDGYYRIGRNVKFTDYQFEYKGIDYSVDGVATVEGEYMIVVLDGVYQDVNDQWVDAANYELMNEMGEFLAEYRPFRTFIFHLMELQS